MPVSIELELLGDQLLKRTLADYADAVADWRPVWENWANRLTRIMRDAFRSEGARAGGWADLSPDYAAWKARAYPGKTILRRTDALYNSLTRRPLGVEVIEPRFMRIGSGVRSPKGFDYPREHQRGNDRMPRRRIIVLFASERQNWVRAAQRYLHSAAGKQGADASTSGAGVLG